MYRISLLKHEPKDFSYGELRQEWNAAVLPATV